ncbi:MAG: glycoside hydrolase family 5 protein [Clostridia bacterium]|nr:glycoside hydrolase family 5 protein [Clostridia bacterium]
MKKKFIFITVFTILAIIFCLITIKIKKHPQISYPVSENGNLRIENTSIVNENGKIFNLKGISSSGIQWTYDILTYENLKTLKENFNINAFRIAMYTEENGYISNPDFIYEKILNITDILIDLDLYIIIDWHILNDGDPNIYIEEAKVFFDKYSKKYKDTPNIIYEICNEPNGTTVTWNDSIKPYAETIIPIIRNNNPDSIVIVGTPQWCTKFSDIHENPLTFKNILYSCHYYAGTYLNDIKDNIEIMKSKNLPIIVTETGLTDKTGDGELYYKEFNSWINYLHKENISWFYWSFSNTPPTSSILRKDYPFGKNILKYLNDSGKYLLKK